MSYNDIPSIEYLAGLFDGEGCVTLYKQKRSFELVVQVKMADERIPRCLSRRFGGKVTEEQPKGNCKKQYCWRNWAIGALHFLELVRPFLIVKAEQADLGMRFQQRRGRPGLERTEEVKALDSLDKAIITELNKQGQLIKSLEGGK